MEKASTPSTNRLTRSAAKNTPRKLDQEDSLDHSATEDVKHNLRKSSRKVETKPKTNGDNSNSLDSRKLKNVEEMSDCNSIDGCNSEDSNLSIKQSSPTPENYKTSPVISRRSLRARRSITPGPELNSSAMKRSTSEGLLSTPKTRRNSRAKSESKDFVFTPSKSNDSEASNSMAESNSKHTRRKSTLRVIDKIVEEESNTDELGQESDPQGKSVGSTNKSNSPPKTKINQIVEEESNPNELGQENDPKGKSVDSTNKSNSPLKTKINQFVEEESNLNELEQETYPKEKSLDSTIKSNSPSKTKINQIHEEESNSDELGQDNYPKGKSVDSTDKSNSPPKTKINETKEESNLNELEQENDPKGKSLDSTIKSNSPSKTKINQIVEEESNSDKLGQENYPMGKSVDLTNKSNSPPNTKINQIVKEESNLHKLEQGNNPKGKSLDSTIKSNSPSKTKINQIVEEESNSDELGQESDPKGKSVDSSKISNSPSKTKINQIVEEESNSDELGQESDPKGKSVDSSKISNSPPKTKINQIVEEDSNSDELIQERDPKGTSVDLTNTPNSPPKTKINQIIEDESNSDKLGHASDPKGKSVDSSSKSNSPPKTKILHDISSHSEGNSLPLNASENLKESPNNKSALSKINKSNTEEEMNLEISQSFEEVSISLAQEESNQSKLALLPEGTENESKMETCKSNGNDSLRQFKLLSMSQELVVLKNDYSMDTCEGTEKDIVGKSSELAKNKSETTKMNVVSESTGVEESVSELNYKPKLPLTTGTAQKNTPGKTDSPKKVSGASLVVDESYNAMVLENNNIDSVIVIEETESVDELISEASSETIPPSLMKNEPSFVEGNSLPIDNESITICSLNSDKQNNDSKVSRIKNDNSFISDEITDLNTTCLEKKTANSYEQIKSLDNDTSKHQDNSEISRIENNECFLSDEKTVLDTTCLETKIANSYEQTSENCTSKKHSNAIDCEKIEDNAVSVVIEDSNSNSAGSAGIDLSENLTSREEIVIQELEEQSIENVDRNKIVEPDKDEIAQASTTVPVENTAEEDKSMLIQDTQNINIIVENDRKELTQIKSGSPITKSCEKNKTPQKRNLVQQQMTDEMYKNDFNLPKTTNIEDENSGSDSDIYKGLSDYGSDGDDKVKDRKGIQFEETLSSEPRSGESGEEYASSDDDNDYDEEEGEEEEEEEEGEEEEENVVEENAAGHDGTLIKDEKNIKTSNGAANGNPSGADSPMTYDKALAILNENREKKIDDEEFFDMFTQELNRVSEESGSDSDIAIVDEYIMDPEEEEKKPSSNKKINNHLNVKQLQRSAPPPSVPLSQSFQLPDQYTGAYNQPNPPVSRMNFTHAGVYNPYSQGMPAMHDGRGALLYEQYGTNIPNPRLFDPLEANYSGAQMFHNTLDPQMCFSDGPPLKVRSILSMNNSQSSNVMNTNYAGPSQSSKSLEISLNDTVGTSERLGPLKAAEDGKEEGGSQSSLASRDTEEAANSPILELLGLDREKLRLLKQVLGLGNKTHHFATQKKNVPKRLIKTRHRAKKVKPRRQKEIVKQIINSTFQSIGHSGEGESSSSRSSHYALFKTFIPKSETRSSVETVKSESREVNLEDGNVSVTINTRRKTKPRNRARGKQQKRARSNSSNSSEAGLKFMRKCKQTMDSSSESEQKIKPRKMTKKNFQNKKSTKKSHILKSKSGTFTVDPLTSTSQSSDAESLTTSPSVFLEELRSSIKSDVASGKNRLSNLFSKHSPQKARASKISDGEEVNSKRNQKIKKSLKLPADFLEKLAKDEGKSKRQLSESGSEEVAEKPPRKMRKRRVKVKSVLAEQDYIPLVTGGGATQFSLARLDRYNTLSAAEQVAQMRAAHLYGPNVQRITSKELLAVKKKQAIKEASSKKMLKKKVKKENE